MRKLFNPVLMNKLIRIEWSSAIGVPTKLMDVTHPWAKRQIDSPAAGAKTNYIIPKPCGLHFVSISYVIPDFFGGFLCFRRFRVFFELVFHYDLYSRNEGMKSWVEWYFFGPGESKSACIQDDLLLSSCIVRDRLLVVLIVDLVRMRHDLLSLNTD